MRTRKVKTYVRRTLVFTFAVGKLWLGCLPSGENAFNTSTIVQDVHSVAKSAVV